MWSWEGTQFEPHFDPSRDFYMWLRFRRENKENWMAISGYPPYYMIYSISSIRYEPYDMVHDIWRYHIGHFIWPIWYGSYHASQTIWAISYGSYHLLDYWFLAFVKPSNFFPSFFRLRTSFDNQQNITFTSNVWSFQWNKNRNCL